MIVVELKDHSGPLYANKSGYPPAFPRPGSTKTLDNERVVFWNYSWTPNVPTPMHLHDKDVVVVFRYDGSLKSTTPDGKSVVNDYTSGSIRFNRGRSRSLRGTRERAAERHDDGAQVGDPVVNGGSNALLAAEISCHCSTVSSWSRGVSSPGRHKAISCAG